MTEITIKRGEHEATITDNGMVRVEYKKNGKFVGGFITASVDGALKRIDEDLPQDEGAQANAEGYDLYRIRNIYTDDCLYSDGYPEAYGDLVKTVLSGDTAWILEGLTFTGYFFAEETLVDGYDLAK